MRVTCVVGQVCSNITLGFCCYVLVALVAVTQCAMQGAKRQKACDNNKAVVVVDEMDTDSETTVVPWFKGKLAKVCTCKYGQVLSLGLKLLFFNES